MKFLIILIFWFSIDVLVAQNNVQLQFKDRHFSDVTTMMVHPDGHHFVTADASGKIILWSTDNFEYVKTIAPSRPGRPVRSMRFRDNGRVLMTTEGTQNRTFSNWSRMGYLEESHTDSVAFYFPFQNIPAKTALISADLFNGPTADVFITIAYHENQYVAIGLSDEISDDVLFEHIGFGVVDQAALSNDQRLLALVKPDDNMSLIKNHQLSIVELESDENIFEAKFDGQIIHLEFDSKGTQLLIVSHHSSSSAGTKEIRIYSCSLKSGEFKLMNSFESLFTPPTSVSKSPYSDSRLIILYDLLNPLIIDLSSPKFRNLSEDLNFSLGQFPTSASFMPGSNQLVFWAKSNPYSNETSPNIFVLNIELNNILHGYSLPELTEQRAWFFQDNSWFVQTNGQNYGRAFSVMGLKEPFFKYYRKGTLSNRFGKQHFPDYMKSKHGLENVDTRNVIIDDRSANIVFGAMKYDKNNDLSNPDGFRNLENYHIVYDIINDSIAWNTILDLEFNQLHGYSNLSKRLLLSNMDENSMSWSSDKTRSFRVQGVGFSKDFIGKNNYTTATLSYDGNSILLIDQENSLKIHSVNTGKVLYQTKIPGFEIKTGQLDDYGFWASYNNWSDTKFGVESATISFEIENSTVKDTLHHNLRLLQVAFRDSMAAMIIENFGVILSNGKFKFYLNSEGPTEVSLNKDGSRLMVSLKNGRIEIYNTYDMSLIGTMMHPNQNQHIITQVEGHFISNVNAEDYLSALKEGTSVSLAAVDELINEPQKVLELFGEPDKHFLKALNLADKKRKRNDSDLLKNQFLATPFSIDRLEINGLQRASVVKSKLVQLDIFTKGILGKLQSVNIFINGTPVQTFSSTNISENHLKIDLELTNGDNYIELSLTNVEGQTTEKIKKYLYADITDRESDLYVLAVGVSEYQDTQHNLSFADKDALDICMLYGNSSQIDPSEYQSRFFGNRYRVVENSEIKRDLKEIKLFDGLYYSSFLDNIIQLDRSGYYWLQKGEKSTHLIWDFTQGKIDTLIFPFELDESMIWEWEFEVIYGHYNKVYIRKANEDWYHLDLSDKEFEKIDMPIPEKSFPTSDGRWIAVTQENYDSSVILMIADYQTSGWSVRETEVIFDERHWSMVEMEAVSSFGNKILASCMDDLWVIEQEGLEYKGSKIEGLLHEVGSIYFFSPDTKSLSCLRRGNEKDSVAWRHYNFDLSQNRIDSTLIFDSKSFEMPGINNIDGKLRWIEAFDSFANKPDFYNDYVKKRIQAVPVSFKNVYTKSLTNQYATRDEIEKELKQFFKVANPEDQVMLFIAGHGVLDSKLNYFYAPHDMDFMNPEEYGIPYEQISIVLKESRALRKLLILDTCHSGEIFDNNTTAESSAQYLSSNDVKRGSKLVTGGGQSEDISELLTLLFQRNNSFTGITTIAASAGMDVAYENKELSNGALTTAIISNIENYANPSMFKLTSEYIVPIELTESFLYQIRQSVIQLTNGKQLPDEREMNIQSGLKIW